MNSIDPMDDDVEEPARLERLRVDGHRRVTIDGRRSHIIRKLRLILPLIALAMTVVVVTWDQGGRHAQPLKKEEVLPASQNIENELLKPVFNSVDDKNQPYTVTADRAVQSRSNPDLLDLENPKASLTQADKTTLGAQSVKGTYEQKTQKLNLNGDVVLTYSEGYTLKTQELRVDIPTQKAFSGRDVFIEGPAGTLEAKGLEGDATSGALVFTGPARVLLKNTGNLFDPKGNTK